MTYKADIGDDITSGLVNTFADNSPYVPLFNLQQHACVCTHNTYTHRCYVTYYHMDVMLIAQKVT